MSLRQRKQLQEMRVRERLLQHRLQHTLPEMQGGSGDSFASPTAGIGRVGCVDADAASQEEIWDNPTDDEADRNASKREVVNASGTEVATKQQDLHRTTPKRKYVVFAVIFWSVKEQVVEGIVGVWVVWVLLVGDSSSDHLRQRSGCGTSTIAQQEQSPFCVLHCETTFECRIR